MKWRHLKYPVTIAAAAAVASCGSNADNRDPTASPLQPVLISVPGISSAVTYSFDLGQIDTKTGMYYVTDRTNKAVDVVNISGGAASALMNPVTLFKAGYAGCNSGGLTGGKTDVNVAMPGCLNIAITANNTYVINNDLSGPDGLDIVGPNLFVGDTNKLWIINKSTGAPLITATTPKGYIAIPNSGPAQVNPGPVTQGFRTDEGCYDPVNHLYATALTADPNNPFYTILDTTAHDADPNGLTAPVVMAQLLMNDSTGAPAGGLEACFFDTRGATANVTTVAAGFMWLNNDGTTANPRGEANGVPIGDLIALRNAGGFPKKIAFNGPAVLASTPDFGVGTSSAPICKLGDGNASCGSVAVKTFGGFGPNCDATGIAPGPAAGFEVGSMCRSGTFLQSLDFIIFNTGGPTTTAPTLVKTVTGAGGGDQVAFDAASNRYYLANSRATAKSTSCFNGGVQVCNLTPKLYVVDGTSHNVVAIVDSGNNAHSVAVGNGMVLMPFAATSATAGGANFPNGGIALYPTM